MEKYEAELLSIKVTNQLNDTHDMVLIMPSQMHADSMNRILMPMVALSCQHEKIDDHFIIRVEGQNLCFERIVKSTSENIEWLDFINSKLIKNVWAAYVGNDGNVKLDFPPIPVC